ncbi:hypothetical protein BT69DRAFT_1367527, partial [Atractiella rhizophila]
ELKPHLNNILLKKTPSRLLDNAEDQYNSVEGRKTGIKLANVVNGDDGPGYYGKRGEEVITDHLTNWLIVERGGTRSKEVMDKQFFLLEQALVTETIIQLIAADKDVDYAEADKIRKASTPYGRIAYPSFEGRAHRAFDRLRDGSYEEEEL